MKKILLICLLILSFTSTTYAWGEELGAALGGAIGESMRGDDTKRNEFINPYYDMKKIKKVAILCSIPDTSLQSGYILDQYINIKFPENLIRQLKKGNIVAEDANQIAAHINYETDGQFGRDINTNGIQSVFPQYLQYLRDHYDAVLNVSILYYNYGNQYQEGYSFQTMNYQTSTVVDSRGNSAIINTPQTTTHVVPGKDVRTALVFIDLKLIDSKTDTLVFGRSEYRIAKKSLFKSGNLDKAGEKIGNDYIKDFIELTSK